VTAAGIAGIVRGWLWKPSGPRRFVAATIRLPGRDAAGAGDEPLAATGADEGPVGAGAVEGGTADSAGTVSPGDVPARGRAAAACRERCLTPSWTSKIRRLTATPHWAQAFI
jgi:hypothetical protein